MKQNDSMDKVCKIFDCKKSTLKGWIDRYKTTKILTRKIRKPVSYKINQEQVIRAVVGCGIETEMVHLISTK